MRAVESQLRAWMIAGLEGEALAHRCLLEALVPLLTAFFRRRMSSGTDEVEDLVQDTLIAVHTRRATYDRARMFTPWLFSIARYKLIDHFRRLRHTVPIDGLENILKVEGFEAACNARLDVDGLLDTLPRKQARVIRAMRIDGNSISEIARSAGLGESDVKVSIHRGLKALAARVARSMQ